jgi:23S rRNA (pseudouridine1915-N3)-methyltransferase
MYYFCQMKITLLAVGKTTSKELEVLIEDYVKRIGHFVKFEIKFIPNQKLSKNLSENEVKTAEGVKILEILKSFESAVLLDDAGETLRSVDFASDLQKQFNHSQKNICYIIGGAYGFSDAVYKTVPRRLSLSKMTLSHQMVRLLFVEQLYRGLAIINHLPYHHE